MKTIITPVELNEMFYESYQERRMCIDPSGLVERHFSAKLPMGKGSFTEISFDGLYIGYGELELGRTTQIHYDPVPEIFSMLFIFSGRTVMQHSGLDLEITLDANGHNLFYLNEETGKKEWMSYPGKPMQGLEISFTPGFFTRFFPGDIDYMKPFTARIANNQSVALTRYRQVITPSMQHIINDILFCNKPAFLKKLFLSARVMELLMLQLDQMQCDGDRQGISKENKERMFEVKSFLENQLEPGFSIHSLAKDFGTNEFSLKKEFKLLFGKSVFDYWNGSRFDHAKQLLKNGYSIQQLADKMGYSNPQNFSTAFKRRFGVAPSTYKAGHSYTMKK